MDLNDENFQISVVDGDIFILEYAESATLLDDALAEWVVTKCSNSQYEQITVFEHMEETRVNFEMIKESCFFLDSQLSKLKNEPKKDFWSKCGLGHYDIEELRLS